MPSIPMNTNRCAQFDFGKYFSTTYLNRWLAVVSVVVAECVWLWIADGLIYFQDGNSHDSISSFIEIAFAVNTSFFFVAVRQYAVRFLAKHIGNGFLRSSSEKNGLPSGVFDELNEAKREIVRRFNSELKKLGRLCMYISMPLAVVCVLLCFVKIDPSWLGYIPLLLWPFVMYIAGMALYYFFFRVMSLKHQIDGSHGWSEVAEIGNDIRAQAQRVAVPKNKG